MSMESFNAQIWQIQKNSLGVVIPIGVCQRNKLKPGMIGKFKIIEIME